MFFFFIVGTKFITWGAERAPQPMRCGECGATANFILKKGMQFITAFFFIPLIPISGVKQMMQCPNCGTRYQATA